MHCVVQTVNWKILKTIRVHFGSIQRPDMAFPASQHKTPLVCLNSGLTWEYYSYKKTKTAPLFTCMKWFRGKGEIICTNANSLSSEAESEVKWVRVDRQNKLFQPQFQFHFICYAPACRKWWLNLDGNSEYSLETTHFHLTSCDQKVPLVFRFKNFHMVSPWQQLSCLAAFLWLAKHT